MLNVKPPSKTEYPVLIKKCTEIEIPVRDKELWFIHYFKALSNYIAVANDWLGFIYITRGMHFQNLAEVSNSLSYDIRVIITG